MARLRRFYAIGPVSLVGVEKILGIGKVAGHEHDSLPPPREDDRFVVDAEVVHFGRQVATVHARMKQEMDGVLLAMCSHGKLRVDEQGKRYEEYYAKLSSGNYGGVSGGCSRNALDGARLSRLYRPISIADQGMARGKECKGYR